MRRFVALAVLPMILLASGGAAAQPAAASTPSPAPAAPGSATEPSTPADAPQEGTAEAPRAVEPVPAPAPVVVEAPPKTPPASPAMVSPGSGVAPPVPLDTSLGGFRPGKGVEIVSVDEKFAFSAHLWAQAMYTVQNARAEDLQDQSFQLRRARLKFVGWAFDKHNKYVVELGLSPRDLLMDAGNTPHTSPLIDWYMQFDHIRDLVITVGQSKVQYNREHVVSASASHHVDLSLANNEFNFNRDVGVDVGSKDLFGWGLMRYHAGIFTGEGRDPFGADSLVPGSTNFGMLYATRVDFLPFGMFEDYREGDLERQEKFGLSVGVGYNYHDQARFVRGNQGPTFVDGGTANYHNFVADMMAKYRGASLGAAFFFRDGSRSLGPLTIDDGAGNQVPPPLQEGRNATGGYVSVGYLLPSLPLEFVARYSLLRQFGASSLTDQDEILGGANWYFYNHQLKLQGEYGRILNRDLFADGADRIRFALVSSF